MALPIAVTPVLEGREAIAFKRNIEEGLRKPTTTIATPNLERAKALAKEYAERKRDRF